MTHKFIKSSLPIFILLCLSIEIVASYWTHQSVTTWYLELSKPSWNPPGWVFGPVWTALYLMIAISGWLIYEAKSSHARSITLTLYGAQLLSNLIWSFLFFALKSPILGFLDIILLAILLIFTIINAWKVHKLSSVLLVPYFIWVVYATTLNAGIWFLNV
jgi:tryptophan-rich sensory protein